MAVPPYINTAAAQTYAGPFVAQSCTTSDKPGAVTGTERFISMQLDLTSVLTWYVNMSNQLSTGQFDAIRAIFVDTSNCGDTVIVNPTNGYTVVAPAGGTNYFPWIAAPNDLQFYAQQINGPTNIIYPTVNIFVLNFVAPPGADGVSTSSADVAANNAKILAAKTGVTTTPGLPTMNVVSFNIYSTDSHTAGYYTYPIYPAVTGEITNFVTLWSAGVRIFSMTGQTATEYQIVDFEGAAGLWYGSGQKLYEDYIFGNGGFNLSKQNCFGVVANGINLVIHSSIASSSAAVWSGVAWAHYVPVAPLSYDVNGQPYYPFPAEPPYWS